MEEKFVGLEVDSVSEPILGKGGQSYVVAKVRLFIHNPNRPKLKRVGGSTVDLVTLVLWLPGTEFPIEGSQRTLKPVNVVPDTGIAKGELLEGTIMVVECDPSHPYIWKGEDGSTIVQREVKIAVLADKDHPLFRQFVIEAIAAKGFIPADETLRRTTSRIPAAIKVDEQQQQGGSTPTPEVILQDPFGSGDQGGQGGATT